MLSKFSMGAGGASPKPPVALIGRTGQGYNTTDAARTLTLTGVPVGSFILAMTSNRTATAPAVSSGFTDVGALNSGISRSIRLQKTIATSTSVTINYTGASADLFCFENASDVATLVFGPGNTTTTAQYVPALSSLDTKGRGYILYATYLSTQSATNYIPTLTSPYANLPTANNALFRANNSLASIAQTNFTITTAGVANSNYVVEIL